MIKVSIIVNWVNANKWATCEGYLMQQDYTNTEIVAVDGRGITEGEAMLLGLANATGDIILICNDDTYMPPNWVRQHLAYYPQYDAVFGWPATTVKHAAFRNMSVKHSVLDALKLRNIEAFQDTDFALRFEKAGYKAAIAPQIRYIHDDKSSNIVRLFFSAFNAAILVRKNKPIFKVREFSYVLNPITLVGFFVGFWFPLNHPRRFRRSK